MGNELDGFYRNTGVILGGILGFWGEFVDVWVDVLAGCSRRAWARGELGTVAGETGWLLAARAGSGAGAGSCPGTVPGRGAWPVAGWGLAVRLGGCGSVDVSCGWHGLVFLWWSLRFEGGLALVLPWTCL